MGLDLLLKFSVKQKFDLNEALKEIKPMLVEDEVVILAYKSTRDKIWFTNQRLITLDVQGLTGIKKAYQTFPYSKIATYLVETAGLLDTDGDFKIWVSGYGVFEIKFSEKLDITEPSKLLSRYIL